MTPDPTPKPTHLGRVYLPTILPLGAVLAATILASMAWADLHSRLSSLQKDVASTQEAYAKFRIEAKAKDAELAAALSAMREQSFGRQEVLLTRLTRIETILERLDRQSGPNDTLPRAR